MTRTEPCNICNGTGRVAKPVNATTTHPPEMTDCPRCGGSGITHWREISDYDCEAKAKELYWKAVEGCGITRIAAALREAFEAGSAPDSIEARNRARRMKQCLAAMHAAMRAYEMDVDDETPYEHRRMMDEAWSLIQSEPK